MWVLFWVLFVIVSTVYLLSRVWGVWGQTKELGSELAIASQRLENVQGQLELLGENIGSPDELAVFAGPASARKERDRNRTDSRRVRQQRRVATRPAWAKHVD